MEHAEGPNGIKGIRLEAPENGVDSEVLLGSLALEALARDTSHPGAKRAKELKIILQDCFLDATPYELFEGDVELLREALERDIAEPRPDDVSELQRLATRSYAVKASEMLTAIQASSE